MQENDYLCRDGGVMRFDGLGVNVGLDIISQGLVDVGDKVNIIGSVVR